jgi:2'-5' RNA ligase
VLWAGLEATPALETLQAACEDAAVAAGLAPEGRAWRPHLTLGRFRAGAVRPRLPEVALGDARLERVVLFRSALGRDGAVYTPLAVLPLAR